MPLSTKELEKSLHIALNSSKAVWTSECLDTEILLDWIEQEPCYSSEREIIRHLVTCAYCQQHYVELAELRAPIAYSRYPQVIKWVHTLTTEGIVPPVNWAQKTLALMHQAYQTSLQEPTRSLRFLQIRPVFTVIRSQQPTLHWPDIAMAEEYIVEILSQNHPKTVWRESAGSNPYFTLPDQLPLKPGGIYLWQVTAHVGDNPIHSSAAAFAVLTTPLRQQVEALERELDDASLELVGLYETYGLYEEALHQIDKIFERRAEDRVVCAIRSKLMEQLRISDIPAKVTPYISKSALL